MYSGVEDVAVKAAAEGNSNATADGYVYGYEDLEGYQVGISVSADAFAKDSSEAYATYNVVAEYDSYVNSASRAFASGTGKAWAGAGDARGGNSDSAVYTGSTADLTSTATAVDAGEAKALIRNACEETEAALAPPRGCARQRV